MCQASRSGGGERSDGVVGQEAIDLTAGCGGQTGQNPTQIIDRICLQQLAPAGDRVDHRRAPAGIRVADVEPVLRAEFGSGGSV